MSQVLFNNEFTFHIEMCSLTIRQNIGVWIGVTYGIRSASTLHDTWFHLSFPHVIRYLVMCMCFDWQLIMQINFSTQLTFTHAELLKNNVVKLMISCTKVYICKSITCVLVVNNYSVNSQVWGTWTNFDKAHVQYHPYFYNVMVDKCCSACPFVLPISSMIYITKSKIGHSIQEKV